MALVTLTEALGILAFFALTAYFAISRLVHKPHPAPRRDLSKVASSADTLVSLLKADAVPMEVLHQRYSSLLELVRRLIGVVPNCDPYLEIWPPAFCTYNVMVPNFLNLPFSFLGAGPGGLVGLGM